LMTSLSVKFIFTVTVNLLSIILQLRTVSVVVGMDAELEESSVDDVVRCEDRIVSQSRALLSTDSRREVQRKVDELDEILGRFGCETSLVVISRANSLALYFICMTLSALMSLRDQWRSRQLRDTVQSLFTFLSGATDSDTVYVKRLIWPIFDYERCLEFLSPVQGKQTVLTIIIIVMIIIFVY